MREAFGAPPSSVLDAIERLTGARSAVLLRDAPDEASPVALRAVDGPASDDSRYQVLGEIARGGIGVVYKGRDKDLGREVALKVLRPEFAENSETLRRFVEEAQIGGQLQHPGLVPVYGMGLQPDGRPYFAMRLIKGETLTAMMRGADRARLVAIFEQVAQTVAYAHSRGVVHRDLKPSNVMVGAFGEVQVVDWGFAKVLGRREEGRRGGETIVATVRTADEGSGSLAGSIMGTPAYMPPEQALGHVGDLDERTDVFALGAILCEILTGEPVYGGGRSDQLLAAAQARVDSALERLAGCDAHDGLKSLARDCLAPLPKDRPANAAVVAERLHDHLASVEERARAAEVDAVEAEVRVDQERYRRRRTIAVAASLLLAIALGGGAFLWRQAGARARADAAAPLVGAAMREATAHEGAGAWPAAVSAAAKAVDLAETAGADGDLLASARALAARVRHEEAAAQAEAGRRAEDEALLAELEDIRMRRADELDAAQADALLVAALSRRGFDLSRPGPIAERLGASHLAAEFASQFDSWSFLRALWPALPDVDWIVLDALAREIDPVAEHDALRDAMHRSDAPAVLAWLEGKEIDALPRTILPIVGQCLAGLGRRESALAFLRRARDRHPDDFWIQLQLATSCDDDPGATTLSFSHAEEAARALAAACALRPASATALNMLGVALGSLGDHDGAERAFGTALRLAPDCAALHNNVAVSRHAAGDLAGAIAEYREAVRLDPDCVIAHAHLGARLFEAGDPDGAIVECREAIRLDRDFVGAHETLGSALRAKGDGPGAAAAFREAIRLGPQDPTLHVNLGATLCDDANDFPGAAAEFREAIRLDPGNAVAHFYLGHALLRVGDPAAAALAYREVIRLEPDHRSAYTILGWALVESNDYREAVAALREAARRGQSASPHYALGIALYSLHDWAGATAAFREALRAERIHPQASDWLTRAERMATLGARLPGILKGDDEPADAAEAASFALLCYAERRYEESIRLYEEAFARDPALAESEAYDAACAAALAAAATPDATKAAARRGAALAWLRSCVDGRARAPTWTHWTEDPDLASVRDRIDELPEAEREGWRELWARVAAAREGR